MSAPGAAEVLQPPPTGPPLVLVAAAPGTCYPSAAMTDFRLPSCAPATILTLPEFKTESGADGVLYWPRCLGEGQVLIERIRAADRYLRSDSKAFADLVLAITGDTTPDASAAHSSLRASKQQKREDLAKEFMVAAREVLTQLPHLRLLPMTNAEQRESRWRSPALGGGVRFDVDSGDQVQGTLQQDPIQAEMRYARELFATRVAQVYNVVGPDGPVTTGAQLLEIDDRAMGGTGPQLVTEVFLALQKGAALRPGLGEACAWGLDW